MKHVDDIISTLINTGAHSATKYVSDKLIVRATRRLVRGRVPRRTSNIDIVLTVGRPNYRERKFIKLARKAKEPMPVKKIQLKYPPKKRAA